MNCGIPICEIFHLPETGMYGFRYFIEGRPPHHMLNTCRTLQDALNACDPHGEQIWEKVDPGAGRNILMVSRAYKPGSVLDRMSRK